MRVGIAIDVSTDVSHEFVTENNIYVLPSAVQLGDKRVVYDRDPANTIKFYNEHQDRKARGTESFSVKEIEDLFLNKLALEYDYVFLITLSSSHSMTYDNAHKASFTIMQSYTPVREAQKILGPFALRVVDSQSLFTGPGILAWETVRMLRGKSSPVEIRKRLDELAPHLYNYLVPSDLESLRARGAQRSDDNVSWLQYTLGTAFDIKPVIRTNRAATMPIAMIRHYDKAVEKTFHHCAAQIRRGLLVPMVGVSYGGDPELVRTMPGFVRLQQAAAENGVELMLSMMSPAGATNVGVGAVSIAYCARNPIEFAS